LQRLILFNIHNMSKVYISTLIRPHYKGIKQIIKLRVDFSFCEMPHKGKFDPCMYQSRFFNNTICFLFFIAFLSHSKQPTYKVTICEHCSHFLINLY